MIEQVPRRTAGVVGELPGDGEAEDAGVVVEAGGEVGDAEDGGGVVEEGSFVGDLWWAWGLRVGRLLASSS